MTFVCLYIRSSNFNTPRNRRSSIVVIPPMQICPGDLLVYSKVLTNRQKTLDLESSSQCLNFDSGKYFVFYYPSDLLIN